jgi:hypothetical protein
MSITRFVLRLKSRRSRHRPTAKMAGSIELTDTDLSQLFQRYPDISFDHVDDFTPSSTITETFSSPCSNTTDHDDSFTSKKTTSTAHTTPIRREKAPPEHHEAVSHERFLRRLENVDLPVKSKDELETLAKEVIDLGALIVPTDGEYNDGFLASNSKQILHAADELLVQLKGADTKVAEENENLEFVRTRALFTITDLAGQDLWCIYRQRAKLIAQCVHTCFDELR